MELKKREVTKSDFTMAWKGPLEGYAVNRLKREQWKFRGYEWEDLMQEARVVYADCLIRYAGTVDTPQWFISLYKQAFKTHFADLSTKCSRGPEPHLVHIMSEEDDFSLVPDMPDAGAITYEFLELIEKAPSDVAVVLSLLFSAPSEVLEMAEQAWRCQGRKKVEGNAFLCSMLGIHPPRDLVARVSNYFKHGM